MSAAPEPAGPAAEEALSLSTIADLGAVEDAVPATSAVPPAAAAATKSADEQQGVEPAVSGGQGGGEAGAASQPSSSAEEERDGAPSGTGYVPGSESESGEEESDDEDVADVIARLKGLLSVDEEVGVQLVKPSVLSSFDLQGVAELIQAGRARRIVVMCGAGISVSAGIPDFRSPGTGLYSRLQKYNLPYPHAVFEMSFFRRNPRPFFLLAKELFPGNYLPTPTHFFIRLLHDKGLLLRCFTQNIDSLEHQAGLPPEAVVAAHGNFDSARCIKCGRPHEVDHVRAAVLQGDGNPCYCVKKSCGGLVKPDIVFFGESLPERFHDLATQDLPLADLLIVMGTSLVVHPFAGLVNHVGEEVPRLLVNREKAGEVAPEMRALGYRRGFNFGDGNYRDALFLGDCDDGVRQLCRQLGWEADLDALIAEGRQCFHPQHAAAAEDVRPGVGVYQ